MLNYDVLLLVVFYCDYFFIFDIQTPRGRIYFRAIITEMSVLDMHIQKMSITIFFVKLMLAWALSWTLQCIVLFSLLLSLFHFMIFHEVEKL